MAELTAETHTELDEHLRRNVASLYDELTEGLTRQLRVSELVYAAAERYPGLLPTRAEIDAERELPQKDKRGLEIAQGIFVSHVLADERSGFHLMHSMSQPKAEAVALLPDFRRLGSAELGPMRVDRHGNVGQVTIQNHAFLNSEDDVSTGAMETAIDLVLLDDAIQIGVLRGAPATHAKYAGRRIFGSGINLTHLYYGKISLRRVHARAGAGSGEQALPRPRAPASSTTWSSSGGRRSRGSRPSRRSQSAAPASGCW